MMDRRMRSIARMLTRSLLAAVSVLVIAGPAQATAGSAAGCSHAKQQLAEAKHKLARLKRNEAPAKLIGRARRRVASARLAVDKACGSAVFDVTGLNAKFDAHYTRDEEGNPCTFTNEAHWTASLAPGSFQAHMEVYSHDKRGRPIYIFTGPVRGIPWKAQGRGQATRTCSYPPPGSNGTVTCTFQAERDGSLEVDSDPEAGSPDQMSLNWYFAFSSFQYDMPGNGGSCAYSGEFPPTLNQGEYSPGLFVNTNNDGTNLLEPKAVTTISTASLGGDTTLTYSGSGTASFGGSITASWQASVSLHRR
jgi:hypothetical protein